MLRIGEAAKQFNISNRTLRYWEDEGILKSIRNDKGYRFFDDENSARIYQIVLLRKLKMPISEIERIFKTNNFNIVMKVLINHLETLELNAALYDSLILAVKNLIKQVKGFERLEQVFDYMETQEVLVNPEAFNIMHFLVHDNNIILPNEQPDNIRIVRLPIMTVASYKAESESPEKDCAEVLGQFILENNLHKQAGYRNFGFNNPNPSEYNPVYGYEMWVTIPDEFNLPLPFVKKKFNGGLYASIPACLNEIGERWNQLYKWCMSSKKYEIDYTSQWIEECSMDFEEYISEKVYLHEKQLDLLQPIQYRL